MTYGSWAPLIIFLEHIGDLRRGLGLDYMLYADLNYNKNK